MKTIDPVAPIMLLLIATGCDGSESETNRPPTHPVTGVVTYQDSPVAGALITYRSTAGGDAAYSAFGRTDAEGRYELTTFDSGDGAVTGEYIVTITKYDVPPPPDEPVELSEEEITQAEMAANTSTEPPKNELPQKYSSRESSDLRAAVKEGANEIPFELID